MTKRKNTRVVKKRCNRTLRRQHSQKTRTRSRFSRRRNSQQTRTGTRARARTMRGGKMMKRTCRRGSGMKRIGGMDLKSLPEPTKSKERLEALQNWLASAEGRRETVYDLSYLKLNATEGKLLADSLKNNRVVTTLNISGNDDLEDEDESAIIAISDAISNPKCAISNLDMSDNALFASSDNSGMIAFANAVEKNSSLKELNLASNTMNASDAQLFAEALKINTSLETLNISDNNIGELVLPKGWKEVPLNKKVMYTHTDGTTHKTHPGIREGANAIIEALCVDNQTMRTVNVMGNNIGKELVKRLAEIKEARPQLSSFCGIADDATEANLSKLGMNIDDAVVLATELHTKTTLTSLDISHNISIGELCRDPGWTYDKTRPQGERWVDPSGKPHKHHYRTVPKGVTALANAIKKTPTLTSLNVSNIYLFSFQLQEHGWCGPTNETNGLYKDNAGGYTYELPYGVEPILSGCQALAEVIENNDGLSQLIFGGERTYRDESTAFRPKSCEPATLEVGMTTAELSNMGLSVGGAIIVGKWISHKVHNSLKKLDISKNNICAAGAKALAKALNKNQVLIEINLSNNILGKATTGQRAENDTSGVIAIATAIATMTGLKKLLMGCNDLQGADAGAALGSAIANHMVLTEVDLSGGPSFDSHDVYSGVKDITFADSFAESLKANRTHKTLHMQENGEVGHKFTATIADIDTLKVV